MAQDKQYQPFYSEVHPDVVEELTFRAQCGITDRRTDEQLEWMNSRTSWGSITILQTDEDGKSRVLAAINNQSLSNDKDPYPSIEGTFFRGAKGIIKDATNRFNAYKNQITNFTSGVRSLDATDPEYLAKNYINTVSGRPGPSLQGMTFSLIDSATGAQGLMNEAKVEILVPDVEYFINEFEPIWFRLQNECVLEIGHSVRLDRRPNYGRYVGRLANFSFEYNTDASVSVTLSFKTTTDLATISPHSAITKEKLKLNTTETGYTTLGDFYYAVLSNIASEVLPSTTNNNICHVFEPSYIETYYGLQINGARNTNSIASMEAELRDHLIHEMKQFRLKKPKNTDESESTYDIFMARIKMDAVAPDLENDSKNQGSSGTRVYVSLGMLLKLVTTQILVATKQANILKDTAFNETTNNNLDATENDSTGWVGAKTDIFSPTPAGDTQPSSFPRLQPVVITAAPEFCQTLYFEELVSADHTKVILPGSDKYPTDLYFSDKWFKKKSDVPAGLANVVDEKQENGIPIYIGRIQEFTEDTKSRKRDNLDNITFYSNLTSLPRKRSSALRKFVKPFLSETDKLEQQLAIDSNDRVFGNPANILISLDVIREIEERELSAALSKASVEKAVFDIDIFLNAINKTIKDATGGIVDLNLTTLPTTDVPDVDETKIQFIIYHDVTSTVPENAVYNTKITTIPMFVNKPIRAYDETSQLIGRTGYQRLGTVVRNFKIVSQIPNSVLALSFILTQDSGTFRDMMSNFISWIKTKDGRGKKRQSEEYVSAYQKNLANVRSSKVLYSNAPMQDDVKIGLKNSLQKYMATPKKDLNKLFKFSAPVWPVVVELELDGCYGFRFGDVISVTGMPTVYNNFVFTITKTDHTLVKNEWTTKLTCMMRPRIEPSSLTDSGAVGNLLFPNRQIFVDI